MLSPSEGKEIYERILAQLEGGQELAAEDLAAMMQAAESGYAPAQNAYANILNNMEGNLLASLPWYCKAAQQGEEEAWNTLRELYAAEPLVREQLSRLLTVEQLIALRKRRSEGAGTVSVEGYIATPIAMVVMAIAYFCAPEALFVPIVAGGILLGAIIEFMWKCFYSAARKSD